MGAHTLSCHICAAGLVFNTDAPSFILIVDSRKHLQHSVILCRKNVTFSCPKELHIDISKIRVNPCELDNTKVR